MQASENGATKDNAAGAVSRMIASFGSQLPLEQVLPGLLSECPGPFALRLVDSNRACVASVKSPWSKFC